jgi:hypothetical protein
VVGTATQTPRSFFGLLGVVSAAGISLFALSWHFIPPVWSLQLLLVIVAAALSEFFTFESPNFTFVLSYPLAMTAAVLGGPAASGLVAACSAISVSDIRRRRPVAILAFNLASLVLVSCLAGWAYVLFGGPVLAAGPNAFNTLLASDFPSALWGMIASAAVAAVANLVLISLGIALYRRQNFRTIFLSCLPIMPTQLALPFLGFLMAQVLAINVVTLPLFVFPLVVARQFYQRSSGLRAAYADTVRSLVGALEAKDPYTRGHSERVAGYAIELGRFLGLEDETLERLEYAALLHDLGKLAVPNSVLTKPGSLDSREVGSIREHPSRGAAMVARIPPLRDLAVYVGAHHEWFGGGGYPVGLAGSEIPVLASILSVADCYDAMTTTRAYRPALTRGQAVSELIAGAGTQFDPELVKAFIEGRVGAAPSPESLSNETKTANVVGALADEGR